MSLFDWASLAKYVDHDSKKAYVKEWLDACPSDDPIFLSDVIVRATAEGLPVMIDLADRETEARTMGIDPQKWTILSVRDEWGNVLGEGDEVIKVNKVQGNSTTPERNTAILDGSYSKKYERRVPYPLDVKGCFTASFTDAVYFLLNYGIHGKSGLTMTNKRETSGEPMDTPNGGKLAKWYWRFREVDGEMYANLPKRGKRTKRLRGLDPTPEESNEVSTVRAASTDTDA